MSGHPVVSLLPQLLKRDIAGPDAIRAHLRRTVLSLDDALAYGRVSDRDARLEDDDPVVRACADNPDMAAEIRAEFPRRADFAEALAGSRRLVSEDTYPGQTIAEVDTLKRIVAALALCRFNPVALHALVHHFYCVDEPLAQMRVSIDRLRMEPAHARGRLLAARGAAELEWHPEVVGLLEPVVDGISLGLHHDLVGQVLPLFVRGILFWLADHFQARRPGLVAGRMLSTGEMAVSPFDRVRSALAVYRACCRAPEDREDAQKLEHFHGIVFSNAVLTGRAQVPDLERARTVLSHHGIELRGDGDRPSLHVRYQKSHWTSPMDGQLATVEFSDGEWAITPLARPYFWGPDWQDKPGTITFDSLTDLVLVALEILLPRMTPERVLRV